MHGFISFHFYIHVAAGNQIIWNSIIVFKLNTPLGFFFGILL